MKVAATLLTCASQCAFVSNSSGLPILHAASGIRQPPFSKPSATVVTLCCVESIQIALTLVSVFLIACAQILFKLAARTVTAEAFDWTTAGTWLSPSMLAALAVSTLATAIWVWVLRSANLSIVYPLYALTFVLVPVLDGLVFGSPWTMRLGFGSMLIVLGVAVIGKTG
jgi:drug/metabolite transporter (DMT)-like permease